MEKKIYLARLCLLILAISLLPLRISAMSLFDAMNVNLFSEMKGIVTLEGKPVAGALITRTAIPNNGKEYTDHTKTDDEGRFHFNKMETRMFLKLLPSEPSVNQTVVIEYSDNSYIAWETGAAGDTNKGELNEMDVIGTDKEIDIDLTCELTAESTYKAGAYTTVISGICSWYGQKILD